MHTWREIRNFTRQKFRLAPDEESKICEKLDPEPESLFNFCSSGSLCGCFLQWCKRLQGCSHTPKVLICRKYWNRRKFGQNPWKLGKIPLNRGNMARRCLTSTFAEKQMTFFGGHTKKGLHDLCWRKFIVKSRTTFRASLGNFGQKSLAPPKIYLGKFRLDR